MTTSKPSENETVRIISDQRLLSRVFGVSRFILDAKVGFQLNCIPNFIEETLRIESPLRGQFRMARKRTTLAGVDIPAGSSLLLLPGAANRDPRFFENPYEFDIDRKNARKHLAFGFGIHTCAGAPLARAEGKVTLNRLLDRTSDITISEAAHGPANARRYEYLPTYLFRGLTNLHLEFTPAA